jgi:hypothetical protein
MQFKDQPPDVQELASVLQGGRSKRRRSKGSGFSLDSIDAEMRLSISVNSRLILFSMMDRTLSAAGNKPLGIGFVFV